MPKLRFYKYISFFYIYFFAKFSGLISILIYQILPFYTKRVFRDEKIKKWKPFSQLPVFIFSYLAMSIFNHLVCWRKMDSMWLYLMTFPSIIYYISFLGCIKFIYSDQVSSFLIGTEHFCIRERQFLFIIALDFR